MNNKLQAKDLINIGLFTVLYFVLGCCVAIPIGFVPIFLPVLGSLWTLVTGIPFMLFAVRVKKFGMVTIMADQARADFAAGFGEEYADRVMSVMPMWSIMLVVAGIFLCALLGGVFCKAILKKHFVKAGIA